MKSATLKIFTAVHSWVGLVSGFALFVAFYAGALTMFHEDIHVWQNPHALGSPVETPADVQRLLERTFATYPETRTQSTLVLPGGESPHATMVWRVKGKLMHSSLAGFEAGRELPHSELANLVNSLHYTLGIPVVGIYLMGFISMMYGVALVSGIVIHLPRLTRDLFAVRPGRNLKRFWQDAHNVVGVLSLPFHVVFAVTGAALCLTFLVIGLLNPLIFKGQVAEAMPRALDTWPATPASGNAAVMLPIARLLEASAAATQDKGDPSFAPRIVRFKNVGDANAMIEIRGESGRTAGTRGALALSAVTGQVLDTQLPGGRDTNHAALAVLYGLHLGSYGDLTLRLVYFVLGLLGAFVFYSGNLLWVESRRKQHSGRQARNALWMARATSGVCLGFCVAVSATFIATQVCARWFPGTEVSRIEYGVCFGSWLLCVAWAAWRAPVRSARELLWAAAALSIAVPLVHGLASGWPLWRSVQAGQWSLVIIDAGALALAAGFVALARATARRAVEGTANSVWVEKPAIA